MFRRALLTWLVWAGPVLAQFDSYEADSFPEEDGAWTRSEQVYFAERWLEDGWFVQYAEIADPGPPVEGEQDFYRYELGEMAGPDGLPTWFLEFRVMTDGPQAWGAVAPAAIACGGYTGVLYHFTIARDAVRLIRDPYLPVVFADISPYASHVYYLALFGDAEYRWYVDGELIDSGVPEGPYPTEDSSMTFGARAAIEASETRWDYIRFGVIPIDGSGDYNSDGAVDEADHYFFAECVERATVDGEPAIPGCAWADMNFDGTVDCTDWDLFRNAWTDTDNPPPFLPACPDPPIPAVSDWGLAVLAVLVLTMGTLTFRRTRSTT